MHLEWAVRPSAEVQGLAEAALLHTDPPPPVPHPQTTKAFLPRMLELQNGHIVCLNSVLALSAIPGAIDYCTSKASAFAFMESLTLGLLDCPGVSATTVLPFHTSTEMFQGMRVRSVRR